MPLSDAENNFFKSLQDYANQLKIAYSDKSTLKGNPEDQLKRPVRELIESIYPDQINTRTEAQVEGLGARPDIGVSIQHLLAGHIELKKPGLGANTNKFKGANRKQWQKFSSLPNLVYTDGTEWILYRQGERVSSIVRFSDDIIEEGSKAVSEDDAVNLYGVLADFLNWNPIVPNKPKALAKLLAPLCRLLRNDVEVAAENENSSIRILFEDWRRLFFPEANPKRFADAYAQTLTYALLLARLNGEEDLDPEKAAKALESGHGLLAQTLRLLAQSKARKEISTGVDLLERVIRAIDPAKLSGERDLWLYFYEDFLAAYDSKLRKDFGVYYTPNEVIGCQVRLCSRLLEERFNKPDGYADEGVTFLDPAAGTAAYPLAAIQYGLDKVEKKYGKGIVSSKASEMAKNFYAFEYMVGPYAVGHLRISKTLKDAAASIPEEGLNIFLTDTLENPESDPPRFSFAEREIAEEHKRAQKIKKDTRILVCMGNPPYDREQRDTNSENERRRKGGWVRFGNDFKNKSETEGILKDFIEGAPGIHVKNLYNDYVYFWRWALWKLFENKHSSGPGIISFITASSYLRGPGFTQMRRHFREAFDDLWIIDLEGDNLGARKTENVFAIQTPVAILMGVRYNNSHPGTPSNSYFTKITGTRAEKLSSLKIIKSFEDLEWQECFREWEKPLLPESEGSYFDWPLVTDLFPWQHSGSQYKRTWPVSSQVEILKNRWDILTRSDKDERASLFKESRDRKIIKKYSSATTNLSSGDSISKIASDDPLPKIEQYGFRSFDRQWCIADVRVGDYLRADLWNVISNRQVFLVSFLSEVMGLGPAATISSSVPDLHYFRGSFGGKHVIPLWKDSNAETPNLTSGVLKVLEQSFGYNVSPEDLFGYCYGILACPYYTEKFSEELSIPGPRLPITKNYDLFTQASALGKRLIWLHTYAQRFTPENETVGEVPIGEAINMEAIPVDEDRYPEEYSYDVSTLILTVGDGTIENVRADVWNFSVSGLQVVKSWLDYRMKEGAGRTSSPLDDIRPKQWPTKMTRELLELLWVLEHTLDLYPELEETFTNIIESNCFEEDELPKPTESERGPLPESGSQSSLQFD